MPRHLASLVALLATLALLVATAPSASAQLELPKKRSTGASAGKRNDSNAKGNNKRAGRGVVPHLVCSVCSEHNFTAKMDRPTPDGGYTAFCSVCNRDQPHRRAKDVEQDERLDLPADDSPAVLPGVETSSAPPVTGDGSKYGDGPAAFILEQVATAEDLHDSLVHKAVESLIGLGEPGLVAARIAVHDSSEPVVAAAGRVLILSGVGADAERVQARLRANLPGKSGPMLLDELVRRDPVHGSPAFLVELLEHKRQPMRQSALRHLGKLMTPETLPLLRRPLSSKRTDTRLMAIDLAVRVQDPAVTEMLFEHLADPSARVASRVVSELAGRPDSEIELELLARAFKSRWILRENAYALLAICEREDVLLEPILDERHVDALLGGLESSDPLSVGACAAALAGIGYRSASPSETPWLDRDVTGFMVAAISGKHFHTDFSSLQARVLRRLRLITGEDFGTDGPAWTSWWIEHRADFYAHRAYLGVPEGGAGRIELHYRGTGENAGMLSLIGAGVDERDARKRAGGAEVVLLTERECKDLLSLMEREGVLGPERPPGRRGVTGIGQRLVEVMIAGHGKSFEFGANVREPWFERLVAAMRDVGERNRWQRFPDLARYSTQREFWETEAGWWGGEHSELERAQRMKELVLASLRTSAPTRRGAALKELLRTYEVPGCARREDFAVFLDLLRDEGFYTGRAASLVELCLGAARVGREDGLADPEACDQLARLLLARFQTQALDAMGLVARSAGRDYVRGLVEDERPVLRAVAAAELAREPDPADAELLMSLLADPEPAVEAAAALALGQAHVEAARTELLLRARLGEPAVRSAALRSIGLLGGEYVLEALVLGVSDPDPMVKLGAAEGLVELADPHSAPLFISLLRRGRESEVYDVARRGLIALGDAAKGDLLRVVNSPAHQARREVALLLGGLCSPEVVPALIDMVDDDPADQTLAFELTVLSCVDVRDAPDPAARWAEWYDDVTHQSSLPWFLAALERRGVSAPAVQDFRGEGTRDATLFLLGVLEREEDFLVERARRELGRMLGEDLGELPRAGNERRAWLETLHETLLERDAGGVDGH